MSYYQELLFDGNMSVQKSFSDGYEKCTEFRNRTELNTALRTSSANR